MSIFVCAMTLLCPVWCMAGVSAHCEEHDVDVAVRTAAPCGENGHRPHHEHDPSSDSDPHGDHTCLCTGGTPPGAALQIPALEPAAIIATDNVSLANLDTTFLLGLLKARGPTDTSSGLRFAPLLI